ncbi:MAG: hypothetical protein AB4368_13750 [Xenococcaceae cyanobacterium]
MKKTIKEKLLNQSFLAEVFELRSKATDPYEMAKKFKITIADLRDVLISPEYKQFSKDWFDTIRDSSKIARGKVIKLVNQYETHALRVLFELAESAEKNHERISAAKAALAHCQAVVSAEATREYQEAITRLESLVKEGESNG